MKRLIWIALGCMVVFTPVVAASFDCAKAVSKIEKQICDTPAVSMLDEELRNVYLAVMNKANEEQKQHLMYEQKHWLKYTRNVCADNHCLKQAYLSRLEDLQIFLEKLSEVLAKDVGVFGLERLVALRMPQPILTPPMSLEEIRRLLSVAHAQLKKKQNDAHNVLFFNSRMEETAYCKRFWSVLKNQDTFDIPSPNMLAGLPQEKEKLFELLHDYAKRNFERYMSQDGKLTPDKYTDTVERTWRLGPFVKGKTNNPKDLSQRFEVAWQSNAEYHGFFDQNDLFDQSSATHILYRQPHPIAGYIRPLLITFVRDSCDKCTGISMGIRTVAVDGLPQPEWMEGKYFSQASFTEAQNKSNGSNRLKPLGPYLFMGVGVFNGNLIFWTLKQKIWIEPSSRELAEGLGYYKSGDAKMYFRKYEVDVSSLEEPKYEGVSNICTVGFN